MTDKNYALVGTAIVQELREICGEPHVYDDDKKMRKYSRDQVPEDPSFCRCVTLSVAPLPRAYERLNHA